MKAPWIVVFFGLVTLVLMLSQCAIDVDLGDAPPDVDGGDAT